MAAEQQGLSVEVGITLGKLQRQMAAAEARMVKMANKMEGQFEQSNRAVTRSFARVGSSAANTNSGLSRLQGVMDRNKVVAQQFGFQIGDLATQLSGGTKATTAFAQQGSQLLGIFGPMGALAGAALAVTLPLAGAFWDAGKGAEDAEGGLDKLTGALDDFRKFAEIADSSAEDLKEQFGEFADEVRDVARYMAQVSIAQAMSKLESAIEPMEEGFDRAIRSLEELDRATQAYEKEVGRGSLGSSELTADMREAMELAQDRAEKAAEAVGLMPDQVRDIGKAFSELRAAKDMEQIRNRAKDALDVIEGFYPEGAKLPPVLADAASNLEKVITAAARGVETAADLADEFSRAGDEVERISKAQKFEAGYVMRAASGRGGREEELVRATTELARQMGISAKDLLTVMSYETSGKLDPSITNPQGYTGLIQFSPDNQRRYNVSADSSVTEQVIAAGRYLEDAGVKAGDGLLRIYAAVLAGSPDKVHAVDRYNGGSALTKVNGEMAGHQARAEGLLAAYGGVVQEVTNREAPMRPRSRSDGRAANNEEQWEEEAKAEEKANERRKESYKKLVEVRERFLETGERAVSQAQLESEIAGMTAADQAAARFELQMLNQAKRDGIDLDEKIAGSTMTYREQIRALSEQVRLATAAEERKAKAIENSAERQQFMADTQQRLKDGLIDSIVAGESFADTLANVAQMLAKAALQAALFGDGPLSGGGGGLFGGLASAIFGGGGAAADGSAIAGAIGGVIGGRAAGGPVRAGEAYRINEHTANSEIFVPSRSGAILNASQAQRAIASPSSQAAAQKLAVGITIDGAGNLLAIIRDEAGNVVASQRQSIVGEALGKTPAYLTEQRMRSGHG